MWDREISESPTSWTHGRCSIHWATRTHSEQGLCPTLRECWLIHLSHFFIELKIYHLHLLIWKLFASELYPSLSQSFHISTQIHLLGLNKLLFFGIAFKRQQLICYIIYKLNFHLTLSYYPCLSLNDNFLPCKAALTLIVIIYHLVLKSLELKGLCFTMPNFSHSILVYSVFLLHKQNSALIAKFCCSFIQQA